MMRYMLLFALCGLLSFTTFAQRPGHRGHHGPERLLQQLDLTEQQRTQLRTLRTEQRAKLEAFRGREFDSPEARHTAMRQLRREGRTALEAILTDTQREQLRELHEQRRAERPEVDKRALRQDVKSYRQENIRPVMREQRAQLEPLLSDADKAIIESLRPKAEAAKRELRAGMRDLRNSRGPGQRPDRSQVRARREALEAKYADEIEQVQALVDKYDSDIERLLEEVADQQEDWKQDLHGIFQEHAGQHRPRRESRIEGGGARKGPRGHRHPGMQRLHKAHFLLMRPAPAPGTTGAASALGISPNPVTNQLQLRYTLAADGPVRIALQNAEGKQLRILLSEYQNAGSQRATFDVSELTVGIYYLQVQEGDELRTERFVVARN